MAFPGAVKKCQVAHGVPKRGALLQLGQIKIIFPARRKNPLGKDYGDDQTSEARFQKKSVLSHYGGGQR